MFENQSKIIKLLKYTKAIKKDLKQIITSASDPF